MDAKCIVVSVLLFLLSPIRVWVEMEQVLEAFRMRSMRPKKETSSKSRAAYTERMWKNQLRKKNKSIFVVEYA